MDFITNFFAPYKEMLMSPITWCVIIALLGVIGYFVLMTDNQKVVVQKEEFVAPAMNEQPPMDHIIEHGTDVHDQQDAVQEEVVQETNAVAYDPSESQHVDA